jgi:hypothetical protein
MAPTPRPALEFMTEESPWVRPRVLVGGAVVTFLLLGWMFIPAEHDDAPESVVMDYLTAIRAGDVDTASKLAGIERDDDAESDRFLTAEVATAGDWSVGGTELVFYEESADYSYGYDTDVRIEEASVRYTIDIPGEKPVTGWFELERRSTQDHWRLHSALVKVTLPETPLWYLDVNGVVASDAGISEPEDGKPTQYRLFPGVYRLYQHAPEVVAVDSEAIALFPGKDSAVQAASSDEDHYSPFAVEAPKMTLTKSGTKAAEKAVAELVKQCAKATTLAVPGCPFSADPVTGPQLDDEEYLDDLYNISWKVSEQPVVAIVMTKSGIEVSDRQRGVATVEFSGYDSDNTDSGHQRGDKRSASADCEIRTSALEIGIQSDGSMLVVPQHSRRNGWPDEYYYPEDGNTCE